MIVVRNGILFPAYQFLDQHYISSSEKLSTESVRTNSGGYKTPFDPEDGSVEELFNMDYGVVYDAGIEGTDNEWLLHETNVIRCMIWNDTIALNGWNYPGWEWVDRGWGRKQVAFHDCTGYFLKKTVYAKNGKKKSEPVSKKVYLSRLDFLRAIIFYEYPGGRVLSEYKGEKFLF